MINTTFYVFAIHRFTEFVVPYITSALWHNNDVFVEVASNSTDFLTPEQSDFLTRHFPERWTIRKIPAAYDYTRFSSKHIKSMRWLSMPECRNTYTYIGDIDILILEGGITEMHVKHMQFLKKPYSNVFRNHPTKNKLTGLHFVDTDLYYHKVNKEYLDQVRGNIANGRIPTKMLDEILLYNIVNTHFGMPKTLPHQQLLNPREPWNTFHFRPIHGIHTTLSRPWTGWGVNHVEYAKYKEFSKSDLWLEGTTVFGDWYMNNIGQHIDTVYTMWKMWTEWKRLRTLVPKQVLESNRALETGLMHWHKLRKNKQIKMVLHRLLDRYNNCLEK